MFCKPRSTIMEAIARPLLNRMQLKPENRTWIGELLYQLLQKLESYSSSLDYDIVVEASAAENLMQNLHQERSVLSGANTRCYARVVRTLWEYEDQGYFASSSFINDLGIRTLLETYQDCQDGIFVISALQHMFMTATKQNKRVLVDSVLLYICSQNTKSKHFLQLWEHSIIGSIGRSSMRMEVVKSSLQENCTNDHLIVKSTENFICCIKSSSSSILFDWSILQPSVMKKVHISDEKTAILYIRFLHALAKLQNVDPTYFVNEFVFYLKTSKRPAIDLQCAIYDAIDDLKKRTTTNVYQEFLLKAFSVKTEKR